MVVRVTGEALPLFLHSWNRWANTRQLSGVMRKVTDELFPPLDLAERHIK